MLFCYTMISYGDTRGTLHIDIIHSKNTFFILVNLLIEICEKPVILSFKNNPAGF